MKEQHNIYQSPEAGSTRTITTRPLDLPGERVLINAHCGAQSRPLLKSESEMLIIVRMRKKPFSLQARQSRGGTCKWARCIGDPVIEGGIAIFQDGKKQ